jgi:riboflavin kinase / FMN adenylyltransferase
MRIYRSLAEVPADFGPSALSIGNFDGVHFGHRRILRRVKALAAERGWKASVLTFDPHPTVVVAPERAPRLMTSPEQRARLMEEEGIEQVLIMPFTGEVAHLSPEAFVRGLLVERLGVRAVLVGANFRFGYQHAGDALALAEYGKAFGFETVVVPAVVCRGRMVSSSGIRELLVAGKVAAANRLLQHAYGIEGEVVSGRGVGSKRTVPTLNLETRAEVIPADGVYVTRTRDLEDGREWNSVTNAGNRPTFGEGGERTIETFLLEPGALGTPGAAPRRIRVEFLLRLRGERRFETAEALKQQILKDVRAAESYFRRRKRWAGLVPSCTSS